MKRALAVIGAVVMIAVSIVIRSAIDDDNSPSSNQITIACIPELQAQCRALQHVDVKIEDAATTAKAIADGKADIDGWVTFDPWPQMTALFAQHAIDETTTPVASSDLAIAMVAERAAAIAPTCGGTVTWKCLGDSEGKKWTDVGGKPEWGTVQVGLPPTTFAESVLLLGDAATSYFGKPDFATNDFDDQFRVWKTNLLSSPGTFTDFIHFFPAKFSAVGAVHALADPGARANEVAFTPGAFAVVVVSDLTGRGGRVTNDLRQKLKAAGWSDPKASGLPDAGVLLTLSGLTK